jgi:hypothetical protein
MSRAPPTLSHLTVNARLLFPRQVDELPSLQFGLQIAQASEAFWHLLRDQEASWLFNC